MHRILSASALLALLAVFAAPAAAQTSVSLTAFDGKCISEVNENWNDNRCRAYWNARFVDGFVKFDLSSIPNTATILSMDLTVYHEAGFSNPFADPDVRVYRTAGDSWSRGATNNHPGLNEVLTPTHVGFPSADLVPVVFNLDVSAVTWSGDLADDVLSLVLRNDAGNAGRYSYVYFHSSDSSPAPPVLDVTYVDGGGGLSLSITGPCPGAITIDITGATPNRNVALVTATQLGAFVIPGGFPCTGTTLGLGSQNLTLRITRTASAAGTINFPATAPAAACGVLHVQAIDLTSCQTSNVVSL
ncbi:MAG TPA: DNRLRE domain-containing protein [Planctomycetota bacterium]